MKSPTGSQTSNAWMIRIGWVLTGLTSANIILDSFGKFFPPALLLEEIHRLGESEIPLVPPGVLQTGASMPQRGCRWSSSLSSCVPHPRPQ